MTAGPEDTHKNRKTMYDSGLEWNASDDNLDGFLSEKGRESKKIRHESTGKKKKHSTMTTSVERLSRLN